MEKGKLRQAALQLSVKLVCLHKKKFLKNQLARAGTGIGANIHEANCAESPTDFIHKLKTPLKECHVTEYWLHVRSATCPELSAQAKDLRKEAESIRRMLIRSIRTCQNNLENRLIELSAEKRVKLPPSGGSENKAYISSCLPLGQAGREKAFIADVDGAEIGLYLQQGLVRVVFRQHLFQIFPLPE